MNHRTTIDLLLRTTLATLVMAPLALAQPATHSVPSDHAIAHVNDAGAVHASASATPRFPAADALTLAADTLTFRQHDTTLSSPFFEGRAPGTQGNRRAADYVEFEFRTLGLEPAFPETNPVEPPADWYAHTGTTYRQPFEAPPSRRPGDSFKVTTQSLTFSSPGAEVATPVNTVLTPGTDFAVLGDSGSGNITAQVVFAGYSIDDPDRPYTNFPEGHADLSGKIALLLRFEPMDSRGRSRWTTTGWSPSSSLAMKFDNLVRRGASGIILVNPPGADDPRANSIDGLSNPGGGSKDVPMVLMSTEAGDRLVKALDKEHRTLADFRALADNLDSPCGLIPLSDTANATLHVSVERVPLMTDNVGALLRGHGDLAKELVVIGAHYDHVGYGYFGSRGPDDVGKLHPGADDNASGTSGMLTLARKLSAEYAAMGEGEQARSILFLAFSAEESGLVGSRFYCKNPIAPFADHTLMINLDMIGRLRDGKLELQGCDTAEGLREMVDPYATTSGLTIAFKKGGSGPSDHASFYAKKVPVLFPFTGLHKEYHSPRDTFDLINNEGAAEVIDFVHRVALEAATRPQRLTFHDAGGADSPGPVRSGGGIRFGIAPGDYSGSEPGVLVGDVFPNTPAAKAGVKQDDLIVEWGGNKLTDVENWMPYFSKAKPGDKVTIVVLRGKDRKERVTMEVTLEARGGAR